MFFEDLKRYYSEYLDGKLDVIENKQRLNISKHAHSILTNDISIFYPQQFDKEINISSKFVNHIFRQFYGIAKSSIALQLQNKRNELNKILAEMDSLENKETAISLLLNTYEKKLRSELKERLQTKDYSFYIRVDIKNIKYLASTEGQSESNYYKSNHSKSDGNIGHYIKAILEEYSNLPYVEREAIFYNSHINTINTAIATNVKLEVLLKSRNSILIKPFFIKRDTENLYNYLVGTLSYDNGINWTPGAIRLSSISDCELTKKHSFISISDKNTINEIIQKKGIQFLSDRDHKDIIEVEFTLEGERLFNKVLHLRPMCIEKKGAIYKFDCSLFQAENYFFKFGKNVKILSPQHLADKFALKYLEAFQLYTK